LHWAKRLRFDDDPDETLNYLINVLGRNGVLELTVVASMGALGDVDTKAQTILDMVAFTPGNTYTDFNPDLDTIAEIGIAGLIAGGLAAKTGLLKGIFLFLLAFKKAALVGLLAVCGGIWMALKRLFGRGAQSSS